MNITKKQLRLKMTKIEFLISSNIVLVSRYEYPNRLCLRLPVKDRSKRPNYLVENLSRKDMMLYLVKLYEVLLPMDIHDRWIYLTEVKK